MNAKALVLCSALVPAAALAQQQRPPLFRAGVELITIEAIAIDKDGRPVTDLTAANFSIVADKRSRPVVFAEFVPTRRPAARTGSTPNALDAAAAPAAASPDAGVRAPAQGRAFMFVVDVDAIRAGEGRGALRNVADYLDRLGDGDRAGLVTLPTGRPTVELTLDRRRVKDALGTVVGRMIEPMMTIGEATAMAEGDPAGWVAYVDRRAGEEGTKNCPVPPILLGSAEPGQDMPDGCRADGWFALEVHRDRSRRLLNTLAALAATMAPLEGSKAIVLVSEGLLNDTATARENREMARALARARVALYALHLDVPFVDSAHRGIVTRSRRMDDAVGWEGMGIATDDAQGRALRVVGQATNALARIDAELSGYYILAFERDEKDRDGKRQTVNVRVDRRDVEVRAHGEFTPGPPGTAGR